MRESRMFLLTLWLILKLRGIRMSRNSKEVLEEMKVLMDTILYEGEKWTEKDTKTAAAKVRKATSGLEKLGKEFRKLSVAEGKA